MQDGIAYDTIRLEEYTYNANSMRTRIELAFCSGCGDPYHKLYAYDDVYRLAEEHKRWDAYASTA